MGGFISDEEMAVLEAKQKPKFISDEEMAKLEGSVSHETQPAEASLGQRIGQRLSEVPQRYEKAKETSGGGFLGPVNAAVGEGMRAAGDVVGEFGKTAATLVPKPVRKFAGEQLGKAVLSAKETPGIKQVVGGYERLPESTKYNLGTGLGIAGLVPTWGPMLKGAKEAVDLAGDVIKKPIGEGLKGLAKSNIKIEMRPGQYGAKRGFQAENELKYDLVGKPREVAEKSETALKDLNLKAKAIGAESTETVNLPTLIKKLRSEYPREKYPEDFDKIDSFITGLEDSYRKAYKNPDISLSQAMEMRTRIGDKAAFVGAVDKKGFKVDPEADWKEKLFNKMYGELKDEIQAKAGPELQKINRMQSEIIPIRQVALRRMPISESNLKLRPMDVLTGGIGAGLGATGMGHSVEGALGAAAIGLGVAGARRLAGSSGASKAMYKLGNKLSPSVERPLKKLNPENYPSGKSWDEPLSETQRMDEAYSGGYRPEADMFSDAEKAQVAYKSRLKNQLFGSSKKEIVWGDLGIKKQKEIMDLVNRINSQTETKSKFVELGIIRPFDDVHYDDIVQWVNEVGEKRR